MQKDFKDILSFLAFPKVTSRATLSLVVFTSILALSCALFPHFSYATQSKVATNIKTTATQTNDAKPYWTWDDTTKTLNFKYGEIPADGTEVSLEQYYNGSTGVQGRTWNNHASDCKHVVIDASFDDLSSVPYLSLWFYAMGALEDVSGLGYVHGVTALNNAFDQADTLKNVDIAQLDFSEVKSMALAFSGCTNLSYLDFSGLTPSNLETMFQAFIGCANLKTVNFSGFHTPKLANMSDVFKRCSSLVYLDLSAFDVELNDSRAPTIGAFANCNNLKEINVDGLKWIPNLGGRIDQDFPYYGDTLSRITASEGSFDYVGDALNPNRGAPAGTFYAYQNGSQVPGDTAGPIIPSRITGDTPTIFITDPSATYTDYFFANGGSFPTTSFNNQVQEITPEVASTAGTIATKATAPAQPVRDGYIFKGWKTANGTPVAKDAQGNYDFGNYGVSNNFAFYADWEEGDPVTLSFDANGGTFASSGAATLTLTNQTPGDTLATVETPSKEGYEFGGWKDASGATIEFPLTIPDANATYTATWTAEPGPTPPGPTPGPTPDVTPTADNTGLLPTTGDTNTTKPAIGVIVIALGVSASIFTLMILARKSHSCKSY